MPIDRTATLRNAEKLLRQGKVDAAIAEYVRIVEEQPTDWNTANVLGDLYVRAGRSDRAVEQFIRIADHLNEEGFLPKASALYKKILKLKPDHEHALIQFAEIASSLGTLVEARNALNLVSQLRKKRGDPRGVAQIRIRLGALDPGDYEARANAARARAEMGDLAGAVRDLKDMATELSDKGREADAVGALTEAASIKPEDEEVRERLLGVYIAAGDFERAYECATRVEHFKTLAAALEAKGYPEHALAALREASKLDPGDHALKEHLARAFAARGDLASASEYLTIETAGSDPQLKLMVVELRLRAGAVDDALAIAKAMLDEEPVRRDDIALLGWTVAEQAPEAGYRTVQLAADAAVAQSDWASAAAALQEFVTRVPKHVPALMRLVEICVDGGLEATMYSAQAQLADAYIAAGAGAEARFIAEDLVAREPWERSNVERFRRALVLLGEPDPDALIAERLSGQSPFTSTDLSVTDFPLGPKAAPAAPPPPAAAPPRAAAAPVPEPASKPKEASQPPPKAKAPSKAKRGEADQFELSANAIDLESVLGQFREPPTADEGAEPEIDLSVAIDDFKPGASAPRQVQADDIDGVFEQLRGEAARQPAAEAAEAEYKQGLALRDAGRIDEAIAALQKASRAPRLRFHVASVLGRLYRDRKALPQAIEWFERAAEAPAPTAADSHRLLYELADALESSGEAARALAICLELQADAGAYRDVAARIDRLAKVQTRG